ncbi:extragenic suppressor of kinetochore protein 1 [Cryomyces antarcticus]
MFWRFGGYANISTLDSILDKTDVTVEELLEESDLIQELKQQNSKLIEYLREEPVLEKLLRYVVAPNDSASELTTGEDGNKSGGISSIFGKGKDRSRSKSDAKVSEPGESEEEKREKQRLKYSYVACEILSSEVWSIAEALLEHPLLLRNFWEYLKWSAPLGPLQAGYFTKVNESLLDKKTEEMLALFKSLDNIIPNMLQHVDCPMIMDLLLKIISLEKSEGGQGIVDWLQGQNLIPILLSYLSPEHTSATQTSAGDYLKAIITISANATTQDQSVIGPNELTRQLVSEKCISALVGDMLRGGNPLTVGVGIIIEVIRKNNSDYDLDDQLGPEPKTSDSIYLGTLLREFAKHIPDFMDLILNPHYTVVNSDGTTSTRKRELKAAFGKTIEPLGFDRFKTCELMAELLHCSNMGLLNTRGSEAEVKQRDAERERLKAAAALATRKAASLDAQEFGTSVDSSGYHHAEAPSEAPLGGSPEEIKKLEVQNFYGEDDGFEKVAVPGGDMFLEEIRDDELDEKAAETGLTSLEKCDNTASIHHIPERRALHEPISQSLAHSQHQQLPTAQRASDPEKAESPTSSGLTDKVSELDLDNDTEMTTATPDDTQPSSGKRSVSLLSQQFQTGGEELSKDSNLNRDYVNRALSPHPDDRPAPLFARTSSQQSQSNDLYMGPESALDDQGEDTSIVETEHDSGAIMQEEQSLFESEPDGSPVVGDLLKMMFVEHHVVPTILDFFFRFPWNNFLHNVVYDVVQQVFNGAMERGYNRALAIDLFSTGRITDRIMDGQQRSDKSQAENNTRLGYMGHLTLIAEEVCKFVERHPPELLSPIVIEKAMDPDWIEFVDGTLNETRERDNAVLGGVRPEMAVGQRQAVMNAVNVTQGFGNSGSNALAKAGLTSNNNTPLDSMDLANAGTGFGGSLSGFGSSSDEDDEEMEEGDGDGRAYSSMINDEDQVGELSFEDVEMDYR